MVKSVLVVDDSDSMRRLISATLSDVGYAPVQAENGLDALVRVRTIDRLVLVIADLNMPVMDGIKLVAQLRKTPGTSVVPVLILTTVVDVRLKEQARAVGASGWIVKPFEPTTLVEAVKKLAPC